MEPKIIEENRIGKFSIQSSLLVTASDDEMDAIQELMAKCFIVRAEYKYAGKRIEYEAYSLEFDEADGRCYLPEYEIFVTSHEDDTVTAEFIKA